LLESSGRFDEAATELAICRRIAPLTSDLHFLLATSYFLSAQPRVGSRAASLVSADRLRNAFYPSPIRSCAATRSCQPSARSVRWSLHPPPCLAIDDQKEQRPVAAVRREVSVDALPVSLKARLRPAPPVHRRAPVCGPRRRRAKVGSVCCRAGHHRDRRLHGVVPLPSARQGARLPHPPSAPPPLRTGPLTPSDPPSSRPSRTSTPPLRQSTSSGASSPSTAAPTRLRRCTAARLKSTPTSRFPSEGGGGVF
jgi:hypothetical protein